MLTGKTALITGGAKGIGRAIALKIAEAHGNVAIVYRGSEKRAEDTKNECLTLGVKAQSYQCDVSDFNATKIMVAQIIKDFGNLDILVNNAGITNDKLLIAMKEDDFDSVIATNLKGAFNMTKHVGAYLLKQRKGRIINISSVSGLMGNIGQCNYAAAKAGLIGLTKSTAKEMALRGVTCNAIAPGFIDTDMTKDLKPEIQAEILKLIPLKRLGQPEDIANLCVYLSSEYSNYITGEVIKVDGGLYI
ncbi:3-oxoacyl-[acyl-carrier-protein] reductase [Acetobacterium tundrae]|uniref:3-oxoacyl-[acyl-carrier-protein] reductase n=1 Tax=Acetobacterium tundrae TaxID=132932 RepID=A0ABR6WI76_9FIRM|nr:3-oxoacyl-[acyl-carrier-protein] reductase [Acetobacterium tundrae]MBC3796205.1 3-oxoacyl-[acyl-carrier-protein] reductase [Acetobacterium tundrae]